MRVRVLPACALLVAVVMRAAIASDEEPVFDRPLPLVAGERVVETFTPPVSRDARGTLATTGADQKRSVAQGSAARRDGRRAYTAVRGVLNSDFPPGHADRGDFFLPGPGRQPLGARIARMIAGIEKHKVARLPDDWPLAKLKALAQTLAQDEIERPAAKGEVGVAPGGGAAPPGPRGGPPDRREAPARLRPLEREAARVRPHAAEARDPEEEAEDPGRGPGGAARAREGGAGPEEGRSGGARGREEGPRRGAGGPARRGGAAR